MLSFSPRIFKGETIYSWLTRWALYSGMPTQKVALIHLLGNQAESQLMSHVPSYIPQLSLTSNIPESNLIYEHTVLPYFRAFSNPRCYKLAVQALAKGESQNLYRKLSITANRIPNSPYLNYCPLCSFHDYKTFGTTFWRLEHQLPGVTACQTHKSELMHYAKGRNKLILPPYSIKPPDLIVADEAAVRLATLSCELLSDSLPDTSTDVLNNGYRQRLLESGLAASKFSIKQRKLRDQLEDYWHDIIDEPPIASIFALGGTHKYPACIFQGYATQRHPLKHILLIGCLFESANECIEFCHQTQDLFGFHSDHAITPKPSINNDARNITDAPILEHLLQGKTLRETAKAVGRNITTIKIIAIRNNIEFKRRAKKILASQRRSIWRKLMMGKSTKEIAISHKCSDTAVQKELSCYPELIKLRKRIRFYRKRSQHRTTILSVVTSMNTSTRGLVQSRARSSYTWLFNHDRNWLYSHLPKPIPRRMRPPNSKKTKNWT